MSLFVNRHILNLTSLDSGSVTPFAAVLHRFERPGTYEAKVLRASELMIRFHLIVEEGPQYSSSIDITSVAQPSFVVTPKRYTAFNALRGAGGLSIVIRRVKGEDEEAIEFDSRKLQDGDIFLATLSRPGRYSVTNETGAKGEVTITRPKERVMKYLSPPRNGMIHYMAPEGATVECTDKGFSPASIQIEPFRSLVFMIRAPSRVRIMFEETGVTETESQKRAGSAKQLKSRS